MDQNEKLAKFGVTHVCAVDGYSGKMLGFSTMPIKNNITIYDEVFRKILLEYGLFDQLRVDHGREFYLCLYQQDNLAHLRNNTDRLPYMQTMSVNNHRIERMWVEVNARVNYPIKCALQQLVDSDQLDMDDMCVKYCVSDLSCQISRIGIPNLVSSWNSHTIPGIGVPDILFAENCRSVHIPQHVLPQGNTLAAEYTAYGGRLTMFNTFGEDPLQRDHGLLQTRGNLFGQTCPDLRLVMNSLVNRNAVPFQNAILSLIDITEQLA